MQRPVGPLEGRVGSVAVIGGVHLHAGPLRDQRPVDAVCVFHLDLGERRRVKDRRQRQVVQVDHHLLHPALRKTHREASVRRIPHDPSVKDLVETIAVLRDLHAQPLGKPPRVLALEIRQTRLVAAGDKRDGLDLALDGEVDPSPHLLQVLPA